MKLFGYRHGETMLAEHYFDSAFKKKNNNGRRDEGVSLLVSYNFVSQLVWFLALL